LPFITPKIAQRGFQELLEALLYIEVEKELTNVYSLYILIVFIVLIVVIDQEFYFIKIFQAKYLLYIPFILKLVPEIEVDDIEIEMEEHEFDFTGTLNPKDAFRQAFIVNGEQVAFTYEVDSGVDENSIVQGAVLGQDVEGNEPNYSVYAPDYVEENGYSEDKLYEIFEGLSEIEKDNKVFELKSKIDEMALDNYKEKVSELEEPKQEKKQKKSKGFGMSM
jgi:hypothetical protein